MIMNQCGKVAGSASATILLEKYGVDLIILVGTAGAVDKSLNIEFNSNVIHISYEAAKHLLVKKI